VGSGRVTHRLVEWQGSRPKADEVVSVLMGDDVEKRKNFIQQNAKDVRFLDI